MSDYLDEDYDPLAGLEDEAKALVREALDELGTTIELPMDIPKNQVADIAFPCFLATKELKRPPGDVASAIVEIIGTSSTFEKVESAGPYVNFFFNNDKLVSNTLGLVSRKKDQYGSLPPIGEKIILEHTSANPTGPLHVGRTRNPIIGDTMARILRKRGYDLDAQFYVDDMGKQLVILTWGHENILGLDVDDLRADMKFVKYYQEANRLMEDDPSILDQINHLITIYEEGEPGISDKVRKNCEAILNGMLTSMRRLDVHYDSFAWESKYVRDGSVKEVIEKLRASEFTGDDEGALYLDLEKFGIHGRENKLFLTRSDGTSLYTTRDIAYHIDKHNNFDKMINVLGEDHKLKAEAVSIALNKVLGYEKEVEVIFYAFVSLPEGKMSTRKGQVVYIDDLIEEAVSRALAEVEKRRPELPEEIKLGIAEAVGVGAIRYNIIRVQAEKQMVFKWEEAMNFEG
ncbi:MAG: arginine--tRNA ligase, partial [Thermoplasmata archaeon]|nr:arginine--tRNA ligase [Thermoplasmata archaeon]